MEETKNENLIHPLWFMYDLSSIEEAIFDIDSSEYMKNTFSLNERKLIYEALKWAKDNPNFQFKSILENTPVPGELKFTNEEIYKYLLSFKEFMEIDEFKILSEERELKNPEDYI